MAEQQLLPVELVTPALAELAQLDQWVLSKLVNGQKPPFSPHTRRQCSHSNPEHWSSYQTALSARPGFDWLGFVFHDSDPYSGIDLDGCRDPETGAIEGWAQRIIDMCGSYTEVSPSGTGVKIWVRGNLPEALLVSFGPHKGIEVYSTKRFFTFTGNHLAGTPTEIREAQYALDLMWAEYHKEPTPAAPRKEYKVSKGEAANDRQNARDVIAGLNRSNDAGDYLEHKGATLIRTRGDKRYYTGLAGDQHANGQTYIVSPAKDGNGHICFSYSPNGKLSKADFPRGFRWFDAVCALEHSGDVTATLKELNPIQPRKAHQQPAIVYRTAHQDADAERKRAERRAAAAATLAEIQSRASQDDNLSDRAQLVLLALLETAGTRDWTRASVARLAELTDLCERYVHEGLRELEDTSRPGGAYICSGRRNGSTTFRTFVRLQGYVKCADEYISIACEGGANPPAHENADAASIEDWAWQADDGHSPDELSALESGNTMLPVSPVVEPEAESNNLLDVPPAWRLVPDKRGMWSLRGPMGECEWLGRDENNARICWAVKNLQPGQSVHIRNDVLVSPQPPEPVEQLADQGGGYIGYAGGAQFKADYVPSQEVQPVAPAVPTIIQLDPLVQAPPLSSDTTYVNFIKLWYASQPGAICKRTGKAYSAAQRARFKRDYAAYLVDVSPAEAVLRWEALQRPRRSTRPTERARSQAPARRLAPSAMAQEAFYATG